MKILNFADIKSILFENKTVKQTISKNIFWFTVSAVTSHLLRFVLWVYIARILGATALGEFSFALAFVSLFVFFHDFGLRTIIVREFANDNYKKEEFYSIISLKILLSSAVFILIFISSFFVVQNPEIRFVILILAVVSLINGFIDFFYAFFHARQRMEYRALIEIIQIVLLVSICFLVLFKFPSVRNLSYGYLFNAFLILSLILTFFHFKFFPLKVYWQKSVWRKFLFMSWPLALIFLSGTVYGHIDSVIMGFLGMIKEVGWYNAAFKLIIFATMPAAIISRNFFPVLSKFFQESRKEFQIVCDKQMELVILFIVPLIIGGAVLASKIIETIYGKKFLSSTLAFQILLVSAGFMCLQGVFRDVLISASQQKKVFLATLFGVIVNIIFNLILIPKFSLYGAATAMAVSYFAAFLMSLKFVVQFALIKLSQMKFFFVFIVAVIAAFVMCLAITRPVIYNLNVFLTIIIGAIIYLIVFFGLKSLFNFLYDISK